MNSGTMTMQATQLSTAERRARRRVSVRQAVRRRARRQRRPVHDQAGGDGQPRVAAAVERLRRRHVELALSAEAGHDRRGRAEPEAEMGVRISRRHPGLRQPGDRRPAACSSAATTAPSTRSTPRPAARTGRSRPTAACGRAPSVGLIGRRVRGLHRRPQGQPVRARRRDRRADLEEDARHASLRADHRRAGAGRRQDLRAGVVDRRSARRAAEVRMLHVPRQRRRARSRDRRAAVEELHDHRDADRGRQERRSAPRSTGRPARRCGTRRRSIGRKACSTSAPAIPTPVPR